METASVPERRPRLMQGNQAIAEGALYAGARFLPDIRSRRLPNR